MQTSFSWTRGMHLEEKNEKWADKAISNTALQKGWLGLVLFSLS